MTFLNPTHTATGSLAHALRSVASRIAAALAGLADSYRRYRVYHDTVDALSGLTDRELADMGISRFEITAVAGRAAFIDS